MEDNEGNTEILICNETETSDTQYPQCFLFFMLGMCSIYAFFVFINAPDIFIKAFDNKAIISRLSRSFYFSYFGAFLFGGFFDYFNKSNKVIKFGLFGEILTIPMICVFVCNISSASIYIVIILAALSGIFSCLITNGSKWILENFHNDENEYYAIGMSFCSIIASGFRLFIKGSSHNSNNSDSVVYFGFSTSVYILTLIILFIKLRTPEIKEKFDFKKPIHMSLSRQYWNLLKDLYKTLVFVFINYCLTYALFPGYLIKIKVYENYGDWVKIISVVIFCISDFLGEVFVRKFRIPERITRFLVLARFLFLPIFIISIQGIVYLGDPFWGFVWIIPFGFSNSYLGNILSMSISTVNLSFTENDKKKVINLVFLIKLFGIFIGTCLTFFFDSIK